MVQANAQWMQAGLCRPGVSPPGSDWFADADTPEYMSAIATCMKCPVQETCLAYAFEIESWHGVWGGYSAAQREALVRGASREQVVGIRRTHSRRGAQKGSSLGVSLG